jgi:hypothetical protein
MTLTYENETSTGDSLSESPPAQWNVPMSGQGDKTRGASLKALTGMPISSRFCSWIGQSGRRYVFSVYPASECPAFPDAVLMAVVRDMTGRRCVVSVRDTGAFPEPVVAGVQRELRAFRPGLELHLHLLAASSAERAATVADLAIARD